MFAIKHWFNIDEKIRFLLVGGFNTLFSYILFAGIILLFGSDEYGLKLAFMWTISSVVCYMTQKHFVWQSKNSELPEYAKYIVICVVGYFVNLFILKITYDLISIYIAQGLSVIITTIIQYILYKIFVFRKK